MLKRVMLLGACLALTACFGGGDSKEFLIDNPTGKPLAISVDDQKITVPAKESHNIKLDAGQHTLTLENGEKVKFSVFGAWPRSGESGLINPTRTRYIYVVQKYLAEGVQPAGENGDVHTLTIDGETVTGPFEDLGSELFIDNFAKEWELNPTEAFPESMTSTTNDNYKTKIFRIEDFKHFYNNEFSPSVEYTENMRITESRYQPPVITAHFNSAELQQNLNDATKIYTAFIHAESASDQKDLLKEFEKQNREKWRKPAAGGEELTRYYEIMTNLNHIMMSSILELKP
ncbi:hypothetical protein ACOZ06_003088 [Cronobacter muytjensii]|uniref:Lipoprotein n=1 Tax=Cronobacter muytjensii TaxID=413501 RepID=A0A2T7AR92_9ENTR|nr:MULTISPECIES: hypothetical protein [Cronobacter]ALB71900.1 hypothetical protein AFK63_15205 [Cronobacter muytjensii ATCC 51329]EGT4338507.1 hypothetical protein [Cronobacter muytjensii]EKS1844882.1 hypothetical protein [Cronobacter muytjensii]ELY2497073.1 hypothetical protein [Cronobacter muytjensii]ELY3984776.1 hypothetical protein [Cronobacter muytjensii]